MTRVQATLAKRQDIVSLLSGQLDTAETMLELFDELMFIDEILNGWRG